MPYSLTFDDGPGPSTESLLNLLNEYGVKATFFVLGQNVELTPWLGHEDSSTGKQLVSRAMREGHKIGNHSYTHVYPIDPKVFADEVAKVDEIIHELRRENGIAPSDPIHVRLPFGPQYNREDGDLRPAILAQNNRGHVVWSASFRDWEKRNAAQIAQEMSEHVTACERIGGNAVLLLHDCGESVKVGYDRTSTVEAVRIFLEFAKKNRWKATLDLSPCQVR